MKAKIILEIQKCVLLSKNNFKNTEMFSLSKNNFKNKNIDIEKSKKNVNVKYIKNPKIFISLYNWFFF